VPGNNSAHRDLAEKLAAETFREKPADEKRVDYRAHHKLFIRLKTSCFYEENVHIISTPVGLLTCGFLLFDLQDNRIYRGVHMSTKHWPFFTQSSGQRHATREAEWNGLVSRIWKMR